MQLFCGQCRASYSIADKLLEGRSPFRIQCRKCKGFIQVGKVESIFALESDIPVEHDVGDRYEVRVASGPQGPFTLEDLQRMFSEAVLRKTTPVRVAGESAWRPLDDILDIDTLMKTASNARAPIPLALSHDAPPPEEDQLFGNAQRRPASRAPQAPPPDQSALASLDQLAKVSRPQSGQRKHDDASGLIDVFRTSVSRKVRPLSPFSIKPALEPVAIPEAVEPLEPVEFAPLQAPPETTWRSVVYTGLLVVAIVSAGAVASLWMIHGGLSGGTAPSIPPTAAIAANSDH